MKDKYFLDTNIFVYTFDDLASAKQDRAQKLINTALSDNLGLISSQVIQEFMSVATRKFATIMSLPDLRLYLKQILLPLCEFYPDAEFYDFSMDIKEQTNFSFYDAMIVAAAIRMECEILYSEDLSHNQSIMGLIIKNPFIDIH